MEMILNHYPNKPLYTPHVNHYLIKKIHFCMFLQSIQVSFQVFSSSSTILNLKKQQKENPCPKSPLNVPYSLFISNPLHFNILNCKFTNTNV